MLMGHGQLILYCSHYLIIRQWENRPDWAHDEGQYSQVEWFRRCSVRVGVRDAG